MSDWRWRIGILHGYGEALWQQLDGEIRRVTKPVMTPQGLALVKPLFEVAAASKELQFPVEDVVVMGADAREDLAQDADRVWSDSGIVPVNGHSRIKIE